MKILKKVLWSLEVVIGKIPFFAILAFLLPIQFVLTMTFDRVVLYRNIALWTKSFSFSENSIQSYNIENVQNSQWLPHEHAGLLNGGLF